MRWKAVICAVGLGPLAGCNLAYYTCYNLVNEPLDRLDEHRVSKRLRAEAEAMWLEVCRQYSAPAFTEEFRDGFVEGYADYLEHGGIPQPPAAPPPRLRRGDYLSPGGHALIKDYFAGFQYGTEVASSTGRREFLTVPVLLPDPKPEQPLNIQIPAPPGAAPTPTEPAPTPLPTPTPPPTPLPIPTPTPGLGRPVPPASGDAIPPKPEIIPPAPPKADPPEPVRARLEPIAPSVAPPPDQPPVAQPPPVRTPVAQPPAALPALPFPGK